MAISHLIPRPLKRLLTHLRPAPSLYTYRPDHTVVNDFADFSGLSVRAITYYINHNETLNQREWARLRGEGTWAETAARFYDESPTYVFDLLSVNYSVVAVVDKLDGFSPQILELIRVHPGREFLEFGGGVGVVCELVQGWGNRVTYLDLPGVVMDFALWRFRKYGMLPGGRPPQYVPYGGWRKLRLWAGIEVLTSSPTTLQLPQSYDIIFTDAVFEHLIDPPAVLAELLAHLNPVGLLILLVDLGDDPARPMHRPIDIDALHHQIEAAGCVPLFGAGTFCSAWKRRGGT